MPPPSPVRLGPRPWPSQLQFPFARLITGECADRLHLSGYTGIAAGEGYRIGRPDHLVPGRRVNGGRHERLAVVPQPHLAA